MKLYIFSYFTIGLSFCREVSEDDSSAGAVTVTAACSTEPRLEPPSPSKPATEISACLERKAAS